MPASVHRRSVDPRLARYSSFKHRLNSALSRRHAREMQSSDDGIGGQIPTMRLFGRWGSVRSMVCAISRPW